MPDAESCSLSPPSRLRLRGTDSHTTRAVLPWPRSSTPSSISSLIERRIVTRLAPYSSQRLFSVGSTSPG